MLRRVFILGALTVVLLAAGCGPRLNDETYAELWLGTYKSWDGENDAWDAALRERGTSAEEYDAYTRGLIEAEEERFNRVTEPIYDDFEASITFTGYILAIGLEGFGEEIKEALEEGLQDLE
ncbi:MAG: hypothetical protein GF403_07610 [Candidatus Coatesbacteria bacterium]|nr:hypothetical protein [Candidatus Coatesbacteria bacterium]